MNVRKSVSVIICAAGKGERAGFSKNKLLARINGEPVLKKTVAAFDFPEIDEILLAVSPADQAEITALFKDNEKIRFLLGGATRFQTVKNALNAVNGQIVLIHDGARPFVSREIIENCIRSVQAFGSGICAIPATDTVAVCQEGKIISVPERDTLYQIQTPQGFFRENILFAYTRAFERKDGSYTDDSSVFAQFCGTPRLCAGARENIKLTHAEDFRSSVARCGFGVDTHAFGKAQPYILLAGVKIPSDSGLIAHSDGDVLTHAVMDALLSAAGLRDIGFYFPDSDSAYENANSMLLLQKVVTLISERGFAVQNLSVAVQAEKPRLAKYIDEMKNNLASALGVDPTAVGITAGTNEGLGYVGEGKGITVHAYALLK